jgi:hypothetical protein
VVAGGSGRLDVLVTSSGIGAIGDVTGPMAREVFDTSSKVAVLMLTVQIGGCRDPSTRPGCHTPDTLGAPRDESGAPALVEHSE